MTEFSGKDVCKKKLKMRDPLMCLKVLRDCIFAESMRINSYRCLESYKKITLKEKRSTSPIKKKYNHSILRDLALNNVCIAVIKTHCLIQ